MLPSITGTGRGVVERLTPVPMAERSRCLTLPPTAKAHAEAVGSILAFHQVELRQNATLPVPATLRIAAWNLERCLYPHEAARILQRRNVTLALLSEMDVGVLRTGQVHTIGAIAAALGQGYCFGLEFLELVPPQPPPGFRRVGSDNTEGYHGNGIVSA